MKIIIETSKEKITETEIKNQEVNNEEKSYIRWNVVLKKVGKSISIIFVFLLIFLILSAIFPNMMDVFGYLFTGLVMYYCMSSLFVGMQLYNDYRWNKNVKHRYS